MPIKKLKDLRDKVAMSKTAGKVLDSKAGKAGVKVGNAVTKPFKAVGNYLKENERLNKEASAEYTRRHGVTSSSPTNMSGMMAIKKEIKAKQKAEVPGQWMGSFEEEYAKERSKSNK